VSYGWSVVPSGSGTWLCAGNPLTRTEVIISTGRLNGVIEHGPADLVASAPAGITLKAFNETLNRGGQWLPLDPPDDGRATLGGVVATGMGGAQLTGYGSPRTFVIGMKVVLADGKICKAGGRVVKNVAGYDLCKLFTGSYGTLGVICEVTVKLRPLPARETTISARGSLQSVFEAGWSVYKTGLFPVALELFSADVKNPSRVTSSPGEVQLLIRFAGIEKTVDYQIDKATELLGRLALRDIEIINDDKRIWRDLQLAPLANSLGLSYRIAVKPSQVQRMIETVVEHVDQETVWQAGVADGRIRVMQTDKAAANSQTLIALRASAEALGGSLIIEHAPPRVKSEVDAWAALPATKLMTRVKQELDPAGLLSPGRF
jgi:FAD/FMN-containing dehydrogenase